MISDAVPSFIHFDGFTKGLPYVIFVGSEDEIVVRNVTSRMTPSLVRIDDRH